jgi:hypothetical protein
VISSIMAPPADLVTGPVRQEDIHHDDVRIDVGKAYERSFAVGDCDDFEAFFAQNPLTHTLGVRAVVGQQDPAHPFYDF